MLVCVCACVLSSVLLSMSVYGYLGQDWDAGDENLWELIGHFVSWPLGEQETWLFQFSD